MIKTSIENRQNPIVEGCYIPYDWREDFEADYVDKQYRVQRSVAGGVGVHKGSSIQALSEYIKACGCILEKW